MTNIDPKLFGQWIGIATYDSKPLKSVLILNLESNENCDGQLIEGGSHTGITAKGSVQITSASSSEIKGTVENYKYYNNLGAELDFKTLSQGKLSQPPKSTFHCTINNESLVGTFNSDSGESGSFSLSKEFPSKEGAAAFQCRRISWADFKKLISDSDDTKSFIFRGQSSSIWRLRTSFHRAGRFIVDYFYSSDVQRLRHLINSISNHRFTNTPEDTLALMSLAQHHGFPTPLLDWTQSPYIAAFFAFDSVRELPLNTSIKNQYVRIYKLDRAFSKEPTDSSTDLRHIIDIRIVAPLALTNPRFYPQQSVAMASNIVNIDSYLALLGDAHKEQYLEAYDFDLSERRQALRDLKLMGITSASPFPGIDGACKWLRSEIYE